MMSPRLSSLFVLLLLLAPGVACTPASPEGGGDGDGAGGASLEIAGLVTALDQSPLAGVQVTAYGVSVTSNARGEFSLSTDAPEDRVVIALQKTGYFDVTFARQRTPGSTMNVRVAMLPREVAGTVDNAAGGTVETAGFSGAFSPDSFVRLDGTPLVGQVKVFATYIDPEGAAFGKAMPGGDFSAKNGAGEDGVLTSYGAVAVEAEEEASGEAAQLRKPADFCVAIPAGMLANAPETMQVWLLGNDGVWEEAGTAQKVEGEYCFSAASLGRINCDIFGRTAILTGKACDGESPAPDAELRIGQISTQTDGEGSYSVLVPAGFALELATEFGHATVGPLAAASTTVADVGCGTPDPGPFSCAGYCTALAGCVAETCLVDCEAGMAAAAEDCRTAQEAYGLCAMAAGCDGDRNCPDQQRVLLELCLTEHGTPAYCAVTADPIAQECCNVCESTAVILDYWQDVGAFEGCTDVGAIGCVQYCVTQKEAFAACSQACCPATGCDPDSIDRAASPALGCTSFGPCRRACWTP